MNNERAGNDFAAWLVGKARMRGLSLRAIGQRAGINVSAVANVARGDVQPSIETCFKLAQFFGEDLADVLELAGHRRIAAWIREQRSTEGVQEVFDPRLRLALHGIGRELNEDELLSVIRFIAFVREEARRRQSGEATGE